MRLQNNEWFLVRKKQGRRTHGFWVDYSIITSRISNVGNFIKGSQTILFEVWEIFCASSLRIIRKRTLGCNSAKKLTFFKKKVATLSLKITVHLIL